MIDARKAAQESGEQEDQTQIKNPSSENAKEATQVNRQDQLEKEMKEQ